MQRPQRPDPMTTPRRPQAPAQTAVAYRSAQAAARVPFMADGRFDPARWYALLEESALAVEGAPAPQGVTRGTSTTGGAPPTVSPGDEVFFGSATWALDLPSDLLASLRATLVADPRARRAVEDLAFRELARLMGPSLPAVLEVHIDLAASPGGLRLTADLEGTHHQRVGRTGI